MRNKSATKTEGIPLCHGF